MSLKQTGSQVRSTIKPPGNDLLPNIYGKPNPFTISQEPDWVDLRLSEKNESGIESDAALQTKNQTNRFLSREITKPSSTGKWSLPASNNSKDSFSDLDNTLSLRSVDSVDKSDISPPPVPRKPVALSLQVMAEHKPRLPSRTGRHSVSQDRKPDQIQSVCETGHAGLSSNLLDERAEETMQEWKPLVPNRHTS